VSAKVEIYVKDYCAYCVQAKRLLDTKQVAYHEIAVDKDPQHLQTMLSRSEGRRTVPQIFINDKGIGGYSELRQLEVSGELDHMLAED